MGYVAPRATGCQGGRVAPHPLARGRAEQLPLEGKAIVPCACYAQADATERRMLIQVDGVRLFALEAGAGQPALVFIHGNGADHTAWHKQIAFFSTLTRVVALDQRGHGQSSRDPDGVYSQEKFVADLLAALDSLAVD